MSRSAADRQSAIDAIFNPRNIVVLGASARRRASGNEAIASLLAAGVRPETIRVVHPTAEVIEGIHVTPRIRNLTCAPDVALVSLPPQGLIEALQELDSIGCKAAIVPTSGLSPEIREELDEFLSQSKLAVHGNNCMGVLNVVGATPLWFYEGILTDLKPGPIALVSQSGSATFLTRSVERHGFSRVVSTGNEIDLGSTDYLNWLASDPATSAVGLVVESITDETSFTEAVRSLRLAGKPLVVLKVGRTEAGNRATLAHTGALVASSESYIQYFEALDVPVVKDYDQLAAALQLAAHGIRSGGESVVIITDSGGEAGLAADLATEAGVGLPELTSRTKTALEELIPGASASNPFDAGASPTSDDAYEEAFYMAADDAGVDAVMVILEGHASAPESESRANADMLVGAIQRAAQAGKPVIAASSSTTATSPLLAGLLADVPLSRGIVNSLVALRTTAKNRRPIPEKVDRPSWLPAENTVRDWRARVEIPDTDVPAQLVQDILREYGIPSVESITTSSVEEAADWAEARYPVVAKVTSADVAHRSDVGGVVVGIEHEQGLRDAIERIRESVQRAVPNAVIDGFEIQEQVRDSFEAMVGLTSDPALGPLVVAGSGGVLVELLDDTRSSRVPVNHERATELLEGTKLRRRMEGYRRLAPRTPSDELSDVIVRVSWLAHDFRGLISELDLNPVLIEYGTGRARVVDSLVNFQSFVPPTPQKGVAQPATHG